MGGAIRGDKGDMKTKSADADKSAKSRYSPSVAEFQEAYGEALENTLDLDTWTAGEDLASLYSRLEREIEEAVSKEEDYRKIIREEVFPLIASGAYAPPNA